MACVLATLCILLPGMLGAGYYDKVRQGESLESFAKRHGVAATELRGANRLSAAARPPAGAMLYVPRDRRAGAAKPAAPAAKSKPDPGTYVVQPGDTLSGIGKRHGVTSSAIASANGISSSSPIKVGQRLRIPDRAESTNPAPAKRGEDPAPPASNSGMRDVPGGGIDRDAVRPSRRGFVWPVEGRVVKRFVNNSSEKCFGIRIAAPLGTEVRAARDGRVVFASDSIAAYGRMVIIEHDDNLATCYAHTRRLLVREGERVRQGQVVAEVGDTVRGGSPALHFEIRRRGTAVNPEEYLP